MVLSGVHPPTSTMAPSDDSTNFGPAPTYNAVTFLLLFIVSFIVTVTLFIINLVKSLKISTEQKVLFRQASIHMKGDTVLHDLKLRIGKRISSTNVTMSSSMATTTTTNSQSGHKTE